MSFEEDAGIKLVPLKGQMVGGMFLVDKSDNYQAGRPINGEQVGLTKDDFNRCPVCKRHPVRWEYDNPAGGVFRVCQRCDHHVRDKGFDADFHWALKNVTQEHGINLRFSSLADERKCIENAN